jgi:predicted nucleic acid-binding protein
MIVDASVVIDAVTDPGPRGAAARAALGAEPATQRLLAPGHFAFEVMSGLRAAANRPEHPLREDNLGQALHDAEALEIEIETIPWADVQRAWVLAQASLRYAAAIYVAAAERHHTPLLTADARIERSGVHTICQIVTVTPTEYTPPGGHRRQ